MHPRKTSVTQTHAVETPVDAIVLESTTQPRKLNARDRRKRVLVEEKPQQEINLLVVGYNGTVITAAGTHQKLLSQVLLDHVLASNYAAFYGSTNRCHAFQYGIEEAWDRKANIPNAADKTYTVKQIHRNAATTKQITDNFALETKLQCLAVSSVEDEVTGELGSGYANVLIPMESEHKTPAAGAYLQFDDASRLSRDKNQQLYRIAQHAATTYPEALIHLTFIDDNVTQCNKAFLAFCTDGKQRFSGIRVQMDAVALPVRVDLKVFQHDMASGAGRLLQIPKGKEIFQSNDTSFASRPVSPLRANSLFGVGSAASLAVLASVANKEEKEEKQVEGVKRRKR